MMRDVNDNKYISCLYALTDICNLSVVGPKRTYDIRARYQIDICVGVQSSLFSGLKLDWCFES